MSTATYERIEEIHPHPNADKLEFARVMNYEALVPKGEYMVGEDVIFIHPDSILPDQPWAEPFKKYVRGRVRAIKIRGAYSMGIIAKTNIMPFPGAGDTWYYGKDVSDLLGITKHEPALPKDTKAKGALPFGIYKTDESNWQGLRHLPWGEEVDVTLKIDGQSATYYCKKVNDEWVTGITSRNLEIKMECHNHLTYANEQLQILDKLKAYCQKHDLSLALRGELYGTGIQAHQYNPHSMMPVSWACFNLMNIDTLTYFFKGSEHYYEDACVEMELPTTPVIERAPLTKELIHKYDEELEELFGVGFEGVVMKHSTGSFKVINKFYDSRKT